MAFPPYRILLFLGPVPHRLHVFLLVALWAPGDPPIHRVYGDEQAKELWLEAAPALGAFQVLPPVKVGQADGGIEKRDSQHPQRHQQYFLGDIHILAPKVDLILHAQKPLNRHI